MRGFDQVLRDLSGFVLFGFWVDFVPTARMDTVTIVHQVVHVGGSVLLSEANGQPGLLGGPLLEGEHPDACVRRYDEAAHIALVGRPVVLGVHQPVRRFGQLPEYHGRPPFQVQWLSVRAVVTDVLPPSVGRTLHPPFEALDLLREVNPLHARVLEYALLHRP